MGEEAAIAAREFRRAWLHLRLTPSERAALQERAREEGRQVSDLARAALGAILGTKEQPADMAKSTNRR